MDKNRICSSLGGFWLTINRECNNRCKWCYAQATEFGREIMPLDLAKRILLIMKELNIVAGVIIGGEPTLYRDLVPLIEFMSKLGISSSLVSNGILLHDIDLLKKNLAAGLTDVTISLKAANKKQYIELTGNHNFEKVMKAIQNTCELSLKGGVSITLVKGIAHNLSDVAKTAVDNGAKAIKIDIGTPIIIHDSINCDYVLNPREAAECIMEHYSEINNLECSLVIEISVPFCLFPKDFLKELQEKNQLLSGCQLVRKQGIIFDPLGNVIPCNIFTEQPLGCIDKDFYDGKSLLEFLSSEIVTKFYQATSCLPSKMCYDCPDWTVCCGGCIMKWMAFDPSEFIHGRR